MRRIAKICQDFGRRVQWSAFECWVSPDQWEDLRIKLEKEIDEEKDSLRFYFLGSKWRRRLAVIGIETATDPEGLLLF